MEMRHKILLLDDDPDLLELYQEMLAQLPSRPEIRTATAGVRALALLDAESFRLLICDLKMPKMDGLQVLSIVRRKHPQLRTVALTSVMDEQFRSRVYALGVDLFWQKPTSDPEIKMFLECLESLLDRESENGFRGVQSKSLVDLIQLECISQSSSVLRITNGPQTAKIWVQDGELIDAEADDLLGEAAFRKILSWRTGSFEALPAESSRPRTIFTSYNALLLESAQALDESVSQASSEGPSPAPRSPLADLAKVEGVEFVLTMQPGQTGKHDARGLENPEPMAHWAQRSWERFVALGDRLQAGQLEQIEGLGAFRNVVLTRQADMQFCVGWKPTMTGEQIREMMKKVLSLWGS